MITILFDFDQWTGLESFTKQVAQTPTRLELAKIILQHCEQINADKSFTLRFTKWCYYNIDQTRYFSFTDQELTSFRQLIIPQVKKSPTHNYQLTLF